MGLRVMQREIVQIVEIIQPRCALTFGVAPCDAIASGPELKCYNTRATCRSRDNYVLGEPLHLFFSRGNVADSNVPGVDYCIPSLISVSTSPTIINVAGSSPDANGLGTRAMCTIRFKDHQHTDRLVDPYLSDRTWDPMDRGRGTFWSRWAVRNKFRRNIKVIVHEGYAGQSLSEMNSRQYFVQDMQGPDGSGNVTIRAKDILAVIEERKAQCPVASPGELYDDIGLATNPIIVSGAFITDYPSSGIIRINDEIITYSSVADDIDGRIAFTVTQRGAYGTTTAGHSSTDTVQECVLFPNASVDVTLYTLLHEYGGVPAEYLDTTGWASEVGEFISAYQVNTLITEPTPVIDLVSQLQEQTLVFVWWDERDALVKLRAVRGLEEYPPMLTDAGHIVEGSFKIRDEPRRRSSQIWLWYNRNRFDTSDNDPKSYPRLIIEADLVSESDIEYGEKSVRRVYARWLPTNALAQTTSSRMIQSYRDVPQTAVFRVDAKDRSHWLGSVVAVRHHSDVNSYGLPRARYWLIISAEEIRPGELIEYTCMDVTGLGMISFIMDDSSPDYPGSDGLSGRFCYIGDASGLLSDGEPCGKIN